jgi:starch-binding outer membrane protein, SusD/RagB family
MFAVLRNRRYEMMLNHEARTGRISGVIGGVILTGILAMAGCDNLLVVSPESQVDAAEMDQPRNVELLISGSIGQFECALDRYAWAGGLLGMELSDAQNFPGFQLEVGSRSVPSSGFGLQGWALGGGCPAGVNNALPQFHTALHRARWMADETLRKLDGWTDDEVPNRLRHIATMAAYSGYNRVLLGEGMCSTALDGGPELFPDDLFQEASELFDRSITTGQTVGAGDIVNMARVGQARALQNLGRVSEAATVAAQVPEGFVLYATKSTVNLQRQNRIHYVNHVIEQTTVGELFRDVTTGGMPDPRIPTQDTGGFGVNGVTPLWLQLKYSSPSTPIPIASWEEAQLILAEAAWVSGNEQEAVGIINTLRARVDLSPFESSNREEIWDQILYERSAELFLEGHHLGDIRRYHIPLYPAPGEESEAGIVYGSDTCFPLPDIESRANPNIP